MTIYLVRHGQNEDNLNGVLNGHRDFPLTDLGRDQALNLAKHLKETAKRFDLVLTSPLVRAKETAEIITKELNIENPIVENFLIERNFGIMSGLNVADVAKYGDEQGFEYLKTDTITYFLNPEGAETFPDLLDRAGKFLEYINEKYSDKKDILLVSHGDFGKMIYASFYNLSWKEVLLNFHFGNSEMLILEKDLPEEKRNFFKQEQFNH